jgi:hypothetical protein
MYRSLNRIAWSAIRSKVGNLRSADETGPSVIVSRIAPLRIEETDTTHEVGDSTSLSHHHLLGIAEILLKGRRYGTDALE